MSTFAVARRTALGAVVIALVVALVWVVRTDHRDASRDRAAAQAKATAATSIASLLTYTPTTVSTDLAKESRLLTGSFAKDYRRLVTEVVAPAAKKGQVSTKADVTGVGVTSAQPDAVTLLVFVNVTTTSKDATDPRLSGSRLRVTLDRVGATWRISALDPV